MAQLARRLGPLDATMIVVSGIIGSGIFINPYVVAQKVETPFLILAVWIAGGVIALCGAFVFAELRTVMPRVGGQYAFFREAFHPLVGFLHGWSLLLIIQSGATAAVAVAFAQYMARLADLPPSHGLADRRRAPGRAGRVPLPRHQARRGADQRDHVRSRPAPSPRSSSAPSCSPTARARRSTPLVPPRLGGGGLVSAFFAALVPAMFAYGGWQNSNYVAEEIRDPERNLPRAILIGVADRDRGLRRRQRRLRPRARRAGARRDPRRRPPTLAAARRRRARRRRAQRARSSSRPSASSTSR